jgi:hypothetical protein
MAPELQPLIAEYRAGLEAEMALLHRLEGVAAQQREASRLGDLVSLDTVSDVRQRLMANLVRIEHGLRPIRLSLLQRRREIDSTIEFQELTALHKAAAALVSTIVNSDQESLDALKEAERARRFDARALEQGESTLAAYRRVVSPTLTGATLVNRKG